MKKSQRSGSELPTITAVIIAKNEQEMIANCIETVRWCDQVLVIDNGSIDETATLAENAGAKVISFKSDDFSRTREVALKHVKTDWIFYLDADERVTPRLYQEISVHLETGTAQAIELNRDNFCYGHHFKHGGWSDDRVTRIFDRDALTGWKGKIHESPVFEGEVVTLHTPLVHLTHRSTRDNLLKSADWTIKEAELLFEAGVTSVSFLTLIRKGVAEFVRRAYLRQGYKDGMPGLVEALVQAINRVIVYIQVWELSNQPKLPERYQRLEEEIASSWKHAQ